MCRKISWKCTFTNTTYNINALYASFSLIFSQRHEKNEKLLWPKIRFEALKGRRNQNENGYNSKNERIKLSDALTRCEKKSKL